MLSLSKNRHIHSGMNSIWGPKLDIKVRWEFMSTTFDAGSNSEKSHTHFPRQKAEEVLVALDQVVKRLRWVRPYRRN